MTVPTFKVGDLVEYETKANSNYRRWYCGHTDRGGSGCYVQAVVISVTSIHIITDHDKGLILYWPGPVHIHYDPRQWRRPGYLRHVSQLPEVPFLELELSEPLTTGLTSLPETNQGVLRCFACCRLTKNIQGFTENYQVCDNPKCLMFEK